MADFHQVRAPDYNTPLSVRERRLIVGWERSRTSRVTRTDLVALVGADRASDVTKGLIRKGVLRRVGRGVFLVVPVRAQERPTILSPAVEAAALLSDEPYYLGGLWAFSFHRLSTQRFVSRIDAFISRRSRPRKLSTAELRFHVISAASIAAGEVEVEIERTKLHVSSPERTLLDVLDHPDIVGGVPVALTLVSDALGRLDVRRLVELAAAWSGVSTCQRLAILLERRKASSRQLLPLLERVQENRSLISMLPAAPRRGHVHTRWRVVENDQ